jgi:hypothetical protein
MISSSDEFLKQTDHLACLDVSPERLNAMSIDQLTAAMEQAMDAMTEETYDSTVIDAYLDAIDHKSAIPEYPDVSTAYADFQRRVQAMSGVEVRQAESSYPKPRRKRILRVGLAAVIMVACLLAGVVVAQAAGVDVLGSIAHWTESVFGFGTLSSGNISTNPSPTQNDFSGKKMDVPEEYDEVQVALSEQGLPFYFLKVPSEFEVIEKSLHTNPVTNFVTFSVTYLYGDDCIGFDIIQNDGLSTLIYEKRYW